MAKATFGGARYELVTERELIDITIGGWKLDGPPADVFRRYAPGPWKNTLTDMATGRSVEVTDEQARWLLGADGKVDAARAATLV